MRQTKIAALIVGILTFASANSSAAITREDKSNSEIQLYAPVPPQKGTHWKAGIDYNVLLSPADAPLEAGKVELLELSMYTSIVATDEFRAMFKHWLQNHSDNVTYKRQPSVALGMPHAKLQARVFFAFEDLLRPDLHTLMDRFVKENENFPIYHNIWEPDEASIYKLTARFAAANGIDEDRFRVAYAAAADGLRLRHAIMLTDISHVDGTPTFVIDRRFSVSLQRLTFPEYKIDRDAYEQLFLLMDYLTMAQLRHRRRINP